MSISEYISIIETHLQSAFAQTDSWFEKDAQLRDYKPSNGGWSINEILEHITLTNHYLLVLIEKGSRKALNKLPLSDLAMELSQYDFDTDRLGEISKHQSFEWIRPLHMEPEGKLPLHALKDKMHKQLQECLDTLASLPNGEGILHKTTMTVNNLGKIDVYQYVYFLAQHTLRHITQMQKVEKEYIEQLA